MIFFLVHAELECVTVFSKEVFGFFGTCKRIKKRVCPSVCSSVDSSVCSTHVWNALWLRIFYVTSKSHLFSSLWKIGWAQRSAQASELVSVVERASEASSAEQANEWTWWASKWPSTYIGILLCYLKPPWSVLSWKTAPVDMKYHWEISLQLRAPLRSFARSLMGKRLLSIKWTRRLHTIPSHRAPPHYGLKLYEIDAYSIGPFACPLARLLALLTCFLAPHCSLWSRAPLRSFASLLTHLLPSA